MFPAQPGDCIAHLVGKVSAADWDLAVARIKLYVAVREVLAVEEQRAIDEEAKVEGDQ